MAISENIELNRPAACNDSSHSERSEESHYKRDVSPGQRPTAQHDGGFDIVIGNPPYIKEYTSKSAFDGFRETSPYYMGKMDLWYGFACHGIDLLKTKGMLCFIAQNNWTTSSGAKLMRKKVLEDSKILQMLDFNTYMVFESADIQTMVMLFEKNTTADKYTFDYRTLLAEADKDDMLSLIQKQSTGKTKYLTPKIDRTVLNGKLLTFSCNDDILEKIASGKLFLQADEATNGIHTHHDCVNNKIHREFPDLPVGKAIFVWLCLHNFMEYAKISP